MRLIYLYILIIFVSNLVGVIYVTTGLDNLAELYRPLLWFISLLIGFYISSNEKEILSLFKLVISVTIFSAIIAYLEKFLVTQLYFLYSGGAHYQSNRATGICQDFGDYCLLQTIGCFSSYYIYRVTSDKKYLLIIFFLASSVLLSTSKAGLGLLLIALIFIFKDFINNGKVNIISKLFILLAVLFLSIYAYQYIVNNDKMYNEILDVLNFDIDLPSIYYRLEDLNIVIEKFNNSNIISNLFGIGTNKGDPKSYIEVASLSIIYKTGILGFIFYYSIYLYVIVIFYKKIELNYYPLLFYLLF
ncbi:hypothetical protein PDY_07080 [Photobacterium damselae subsp. damselae]|uniref:hypothetical protein n=1 Tax=Photobacterium damselae TaxID=38293 RepID=UPI00220B1945|nr:hypothetical protein [Photobacterium damselae]BDR33660.1 hypothetical protein PDY_07080 [Photobacterium damselae subsp. damselae]